jgi:hypothetical protein
MAKVEQKTPLNPFGSQYADNSAMFIKQVNELTAKGIQSEEELNLLRLSNVTRLGILRKQQEKDILDAAIKANEKAIEDRLELQKKAVDELEAYELSEAIRVAEEKGETLSEIRKREIKEEFAERRKHLEEQAA